MAKKSRTSNKKSNDSQKKLLALVLIILFIGLGVFLVVSSFAAKGGKGKPGSGTITFIDSPYSVKVADVKYGQDFTVYAVDKVTGAIENPQPEPFSTSGSCNVNGSVVGQWSRTLTNGSVSISAVGSVLANGASCSAGLYVMNSNGYWVQTAQTYFSILP